jgi:KaiC/GvpD/RAD55 family RecA-like ATPase
MKDRDMTSTIKEPNTHLIDVLYIRTGEGKTSKLIERTVELYNKGKQVLYVSLELNREYLQKRFANANPMVKNAGDISETASLEIACLPAYSTVNHITSIIDSYKSCGHSFDAVVIDYLDLVKPTNNDATVLEELNITSIKNGFSIYTAQQLGI